VSEDLFLAVDTSLRERGREGEREEGERERGREGQPLFPSMVLNPF
jgi:hypothetical protein